MKRKLTQADLEFISQNMRLSGFSGKITPEIANHEVDLEKIAKSAGRMGAQIPSSIQKSLQLENKKRQLRLAMSRWLKKQKPPRD